MAKLMTCKGSETAETLPNLFISLLVATIRYDLLVLLSMIVPHAQSVHHEVAAKASKSWAKIFECAMSLMGFLLQGGRLFLRSLSGRHASLM